jgi:two-component system sensor histidine kinase MtrB
VADPHRFRRRLTAAFIVVAAVSSGTLAVLTYGVTSGYRWRAFERMSHHEVRIALALAPDRLDDHGFERMHAAYERRSGTDTVALTGDRTYTSAVALTAEDVPAEVRSGPPGELVTTRATRAGHDYLVVGGDGPDGSRYVFFFALDQVKGSLRELRTVLLSGWTLVVVLSAAAGHLVARRTLRPVQEAAEVRRVADRERQLTADVAHDLRTPLTGMGATAELLEAQLDDLPDPARRAAAVIVRDVARLQELVLDLLELSRLDARADPVRAEPLDVRSALDAAVAGLHLAADVEVTIEVEDGLVVRAERARFRRIVGNLVGNAVVHGRGRVDVVARRDGRRVAIAVHDDGPGVDPDRAEQIFDRFAKGDASRAGGGSGLGLAIAREHARAQGGDVTLDPGPGRGATFTVRLPAADRSVTVVSQVLRGASRPPTAEDAEVAER